MKIIKLDTEEAIQVQKRLEDNDGFCPCAIIKNDDTKCMCKEFREQETPGICHCGLYEKKN